MVYTFTEAVKLVLSKGRILDYKGRACRSEFWWFSLFSTLVNFAFIPFIAIFAFIPYIGMILCILSIIALIVFDAVLFVASIFLAIRRLHDKNLTGWLYLIQFIPFGPFVLLVLYILEGTKGPNKYGEDPTENKINVKPEDSYVNKFASKFKKNDNNSSANTTSSTNDANAQTETKEEDKDLIFKNNPFDKKESEEKDTENNTADNKESEEKNADNNTADNKDNKNA